MSINHFSSDLPETHWWTQPPQMMEPASPKHQPLISPPSPIWPTSHLHHLPFTATATASMATKKSTFSFNLNQEDDEEFEDQPTTKDQYPQQEIQKDPMFEKPLTPSDVGKLNRLVIPKQHAEKYFPLAGGGGGDSGEKGLLLSFEDESGKSWRFRYSYWSSSQSYVLTKGWSRFVKEKRLDAGDIVFFERHTADVERIFIGWRRRAAAPVHDSGLAQPAVVAANSGDVGGWTRVFYAAPSYPSHSHGPLLPYQLDSLHAGSNVPNQTTPSGNSKRLRLFGVNLECQPDESEPPAPDGSSMSTEGQAHYQYYSSKPHASNLHNHMDINFSSQMRYHQG